MIIVVKHVIIEGAGTLYSFFENRNKLIKTVELERGERLPESFKSVEAIVVMGGPMNVYEEDKYPFIREENSFIKSAIKRHIPFLGICLGAQLLAKACGAKIRKAREKEIGWYKATLTTEGEEDALFKGLSSALDVFQWHEDTFEIPENGCLLATSDGCKNQAVRVGNNAYGLQFHIEVTEDMIKDWSLEAAVMTYREIKTKFDMQADKIYENFLGLIEAYA